jgi:hypothetical protein
MAALVFCMAQPVHATTYNIQVDYEGYFRLDLDISSIDPSNTSTIVNSNDWVVTRFSLRDDILYDPGNIPLYAPATIEGSFAFSLDTASLTGLDNLYPLPDAGYFSGSFHTDYSSYYFETPDTLSSAQIHKVPATYGIATMIEPPAPAPLPGAVWLFGSGIIALLGTVKRKTRA